MNYTIIFLPVCSSLERVLTVRTPKNPGVLVSLNGFVGGQEMPRNEKIHYICTWVCSRFGWRPKAMLRLASRLRAQGGECFGSRTGRGRSCKILRTVRKIPSITNNILIQNTTIYWFFFTPTKTKIKWQPTILNSFLEDLLGVTILFLSWQKLVKTIKVSIL